MTRRHRAITRLAAVAIVVVVVVGCAPNDPSPSRPIATDAVVTPTGTPTANASAVPSPSTVSVRVSPARWSDCGGGFLCAQVRVPSDYAAPSAGYLNVSIIRWPAADRAARIGSLFVNPGGPGASGVEFVRQSAGADLFPAELHKRFDIVGFDPRGVNSSTAVRCIDNLDPQAALDPSPDTPAELTALVSSAHEYADECAKRNDATLPYLSTDAVARDLDVLRAAVGDAKLTYLGFSYGTLIGSLYADLFPDHVRAMALDGAMDPALDLEQLRAGQARAFERALSSFLGDCADRPACAFHGGDSPAKAFDALMARIDRRPLKAELLDDPREVGPGLAWYAVLAALYSRDSWSTLARTLALADHGDGSLMLLIADPYRGRSPDGSYSNQQDAYTANICLDFPAPTNVSAYTAWAKRFKDTAPHFAAMIAYNDLACAFWPVPATRTPASVSATGAAPIVVIGSTGDPATPYPWAVSLAKELDSGVLVTRRGEGHTGYLSSDCVQGAVDRYLLDLKAPKDGLSCD